MRIIFIYELFLYAEIRLFSGGETPPLPAGLEYAIIRLFFWTVEDAGPYNEFYYFL